MKRPIENNSSPGQAVYEPFCGSGTTIIAAEMTGRSCHAIELNPAYVDVAIRRWQDFTGEAGDPRWRGRTFAEVAAERGVADERAASRCGTIRGYVATQTAVAPTGQRRSTARGTLALGPFAPLGGLS